MKKGFSVWAVAFVVMAFWAWGGETRAESAPNALNAVVYFTGIGCPHCAHVDPVLLKDKMREGNLLVVEYEIYQDSANAPLLMAYDNQFKTSLGVPMLITDARQGGAIVGDAPILDALDQKTLSTNGDQIALPAGLRSFADLPLTDLPRLPKIWYKDRAAARRDARSTESETIKAFLADGTIPQGCQPTKETSIMLSDARASFAKACAFNGWVLYSDAAQENKTAISFDKTTGPTEQTGQTEQMAETTKDTIPLGKVISLALADAVNPCEFAVLTMLLVSIIAYNPHKKRNIIWAGLSFSLAVFIMYLIYGLFIIKSFQMVQGITWVRPFLYKGLGVVAVLLGLLQIKDFFCYKIGSFATEMPMSWRPKVKGLIARVTSPAGAFVVGLMVTLFLLPCTIGPYIILGGMLSVMEIVKTLPTLLLYNTIFIAPMLLITLIVYLGLGRVEDVQDWKDKNIRTLHLIAGFLILGIGVAMIGGWI